VKFSLFKRAIKEVAEGFGGEDRLGRGAQGMVYRTTYNGKPAVVKVLTTAAAMKEVNNTRMIQGLKAKAPSDIAPYLPEIFRADMVDHGGGKRWYNHYGAAVSGTGCDKARVIPTAV